MMRLKEIVLILFSCLAFTIHVFAQNNDSVAVVRVMSYNVENFLDYRHDSLLSIPDTANTKGWNASRYYQKRDNIARVITAVGGWNPPVLVGLCEVQSQRVLDDLTRYSALRNLHYKVSHFESPDPRGIDVALLYQPKFFKPYQEKPVRIRFADNPRRHTRDILYVAGKLRNGDTLHVFVNHFPSRLGGELESQNARLQVAAVLRRQVDSLFMLNSRANIIIMGDFNDYPDNNSMTRVLEALPDDAPIAEKSLFNLCYTTNKAARIGSYKHAGEWGMLDQIIVSSHLLNSDALVYTSRSTLHVFDAPFLLEDDLKWFGKQPFRTYVGMKYHGGFSDHLPVYIDLYVRKRLKLHPDK